MMSDTQSALSVRYASRCDTGAERGSSEDAAYACDRLLAVADGVRGPGGAAASATVFDALKTLRPADAPATTLTAMLRRGTQLALVHIGDTRAYLLRGGELSQLTRDHTWVEAQVEQGKLGHDEVASHPQRALLTRAIGAGTQPVEADLALRSALPGDRYLLCSDGLSTVVNRGTMRTVLDAAVDPAQAVQRLVESAYAEGAPDNIACVVADMTLVPL